MEDKTIKCSECQEEFVFTAGEQEFYQTKGLNDPKKCRACRDKFKAEKAKQRGKRNFRREN